MLGKAVVLSVPATQVGNGSLAFFSSEDSETFNERRYRRPCVVEPGHRPVGSSELEDHLFCRGGVSNGQQREVVFLPTSLLTWVGRGVERSAGHVDTTAEAVKADIEPSLYSKGVKTPVYI